ncbi:ribonuclease M5 [Mycoplasmoides pirum]|uniref:ribonuclease M5 n=1 Tax=Mycoplasmoides pirum TaxID=2122 RepID=UPI000696C2CA|nr:ribonuclease M5 [Mycoplasmoides pirum]
MSTIKRSSKQRKTIKEVVVVEGKTDTQKLQKLFNVETIETNGSDLTKLKINLIKKASKNQGVILFLDPDYQGNKIRKQIAQHLDSYKECFIKISDVDSKSKKIGIAEANDDAIIDALKNHITNISNIQSISWNDYLNFELNNKNKRLVICNFLKIPYSNHKQLFKKLNLLGITKEELGKIVNERKE